MEFRNVDRARQLVRFDGMVFGNIAPTDIDALIEYRDKACIIYELKHGNTEVPTGQRLAIERMVNDFERSGKKAVAFVCRHDTDWNEDVLLADAIVTSAYWNGEWHRTSGKTALEQTTLYINWIIKEEHK